MPVGKHWLKHENKKLAFIAKYNDKGVLQEPVVEFGEDGKKLRQYFIKGESYDGKYQQWYPESDELQIDYNYVNVV